MVLHIQYRPSPSSRKRARNKDSDCDDCNPISKRINRLHIRHSVEEARDGSIGFNNNNQPVLDPGTQQQLFPSHNALNGQNTHAPSPNQWQNQSPPNPSLSPSNTSAYSNLIGPNDLVGGLGNPAQEASTSNAAHAWSSAATRLADMTQEDPLASTSQCDPYKPDMNSADNPHYYHINELLYNANIERMRRRNRSVHGT